MAAIAPSKSSDQFSISKFIARFRSRRRRACRDTRAPLEQYPLPLVLPEHQHTLSQLGWTTVTFPQIPPPAISGTQSHPEPPNSAEPVPGPHPLQNAYEELFLASQQFFDLPDSEKERWKTRLGSEEGWSKIRGEKEFITLRTLSYTPDVLKAPAKRYWDLMGAYLDSSLERISSTLGLPRGEHEGLRQFVGPCKTMGENEEDKTATMLRLFRYESWEEKVVAEPHADLGLLSVVVGNVAGLEVWDGTKHFGIERTYKTPCATLLAGRQLQRFSNFRYPAGPHRVVSYGNPGASLDETPKYRFSIVFVLRAHVRVLVDSDSLETLITGKWAEPLKGVTAGEMYAKIRSSHFNINAEMKERDDQKKRL
ncbi:hypothetical protein BDV95DRAFT_471004, partial [Massariosphaeria phaeospora]